MHNMLRKYQHPVSIVYDCLAL